MSEIKVGEFVRTKTGFIGKVIARHGGYGLHYELDVNKEIQANFMNGIVHEDNIVKHSKDIMDLIEVGDYVNGWRVNEVQGDGIWVDDHYDNWIGFIKNGDIKTILTHEQFTQNAYELEG